MRKPKRPGCMRVAAHRPHMGQRDLMLPVRPSTPQLGVRFQKPVPSIPLT